MEQKVDFKYEIVDVKGKSVLVTGGTTGIGRSIAILLAQRGARVMIFGRHQQELDAAMRDLHMVSSEAYGLTADSGKIEDVERVFQEVDHQFGGLDILVSNAALPAGSVVNTPSDEINYVIQTNLLGYLYFAKLATERMKAQGKGHIVIIGSMSAVVAEKGSSIYVATKAGLHGFAHSLRKEVNEMGIKVSLIEPGEVGSDMNPRSPEEQRKAQDEMMQMRSEDVAASVYYVLTQPERVDVVLVQIRPHLQLI